jgi:translation initiation factor IF-2
MPIAKKVRIYDLARELKQDTKRVIEDLKREGADVDVPSNSVSVEIAEKVRNKYFPKMETAPKRAIKIIKATKREDAAVSADEEATPVQIEEPREIVVEPKEQTFEAPTLETPVLNEEKTGSSGVHKLLKKRIVVPQEQPQQQQEIPVVEERTVPQAEEIQAVPVEVETESPVETVAEVVEEVPPTPALPVAAEAPRVETPPAVNAPRVFRPTGTSVKQLTLTKDALQKGIKPGERVVSEAQAKTGKLDPNKPADKTANRRDDRKGGARRTDLRGTPGESAQPQKVEGSGRPPAIAPGRVRAALAAGDRPDKAGHLGLDLQLVRLPSTVLTRSAVPIGRPASEMP